MPAKPALLLILPVLLLPLQAAAIILDCEVNVDGTYTCIEIHGTVVTEEARNKAKQEQQKYYQQAQDKCEYREPRRVEAAAQRRREFVDAQIGRASCRERV